MAKPCGLTTADGDVGPEVRSLIGAIGTRDTAIGVAMMCAPPGSPLKATLAARVAADVTDVVIFGLQLPDRGTRKKVAAVAAGWAVLCAASAFAP